MPRLHSISRQKERNYAPPRNYAPLSQIPGYATVYARFLGNKTIVLFCFYRAQHSPAKAKRDTAIANPSVRP